MSGHVAGKCSQIMLPDNVAGFGWSWPTGGECIGAQTQVQVTERPMTTAGFVWMQVAMSIFLSKLGIEETGGSGGNPQTPIYSQSKRR